MGRKPNWPPTPRVHKASGREIVKYLGKTYYLGEAGSIEAKRAYLELLDQLKPPEVGKAAPKQPSADPFPLTISELVEEFDADAKRRYDPAGREAAQFRCSLPPLVRLFADQPARDFGLARLERVRDEMIRLGWRRETINRRVTRIRTLFRWAEQKGLAPPGIWSNLRALSPLRKNDRRAPSIAPRQPVAWKDLAAACRRMSRPARDLLLALWFTGARPSELRTLTVGEVVRDGECWFATPVRHKNAWRGHRRIIQIGPKARAVFARRLEGKTPGEYVFDTSAGRCYGETCFAQEVRRACERAGVSFTAYNLRYSLAARVTGEAGADAARAMLGQKTLAMTAHYSGGADAKLAADAARKCG